MTIEEEVEKAHTEVASAIKVGMTPAEYCERKAIDADLAGRPDIAQSWRQLLEGYDDSRWFN